MCSVRRTKCITYIQISQVSQLFAEFLTVLGLFCATETGILKQNNVAFLHVLNSLGSCFAGYIVVSYESNLFAQLLGQSLGNRCQRFAFVGAILYLTQMRAKNYLAAIVDQLLDGRQSCNDTGIVSDLTVL